MASLCCLRVTRTAFAAALLAAVAVSASSSAHAADDAIYAPGEPIVTGFSGVVPPAALPPGSDPLDYTFIDLDGQSMVIQQLQPDGPPSGQLIPSPSIFSATAGDVGQAFGVTLDNAPELTGAAAPNIYLSATSAFGLNIVVPGPEGNLVRSKLGDPDATFMAGQWGSAGGAQGYPGSIWKVDGETGEISLFSTIAANSGAGLGDIVFDPASSQFFVSDLDTGLIYRLAPDGIIIDTFDHGVTGRPEHGLDSVDDDGTQMDVTDPAFNSEAPATWGFTQPERKVFGLAVHGGRLYYAVADGPQIWSVRLQADGSFGPARWELDVADLTSSNEVAGIIFDPQGRMILAQRGPQVGSYDYSVFAEPQTSSVVRYEREFPDDPATPGTWVETPDSYAIGLPLDGANASGGIALGPDFDEETGAFDGACDAYLWSTGDSLRDDPDLDSPLDPPAQVHGLQGNAHFLVRPQNDPPTLSFFADYDGNTDDEQATAQGHVGAVAIWQTCEGTPETYVPPPFFPPEDYEPPAYGPDEEFNLTLEKWAQPHFCFDGGADWWCSYTIRVENTGTVPYWGPVVVDDYLPANNPGAAMHFWPQPPWDCDPTGPAAYQCVTGPVLLYPGDGIVLHEVVQLPKALVDYCHIANVAGLNWFWGNDDDPSDDFGVGVAGINAPGCVPPGGGTDLLLQKITFPANCFDAGVDWACSYAVFVQNAGPGNFTGPITVTDTLGVNAPATILGPWACAQAGPVLTCNILAPPVNVAPGWSSGFLVTAHVPKNVGAPLCDLDNKANIAAPVAGSPMNLVAGNDFDQATAHILEPACLLPKPDTDPQIQKSGLGCAPFVYLGTNGYICGWQLTITNVGPDPYVGPISFVDTSAGATANSLPLLVPFCAGPPVQVTCTTPGAVLLAPGVPHSVTFHTFYPDGPAVCSATNNVSILAPNPGSAENPAGNDSDTVGLALPNPACFAPGMPKLNIQKTATGCASDPASTDWLCDFDITVFNYGGGPQPGPIHVRDFNDKPTTFSGAACAPAGVNQYLCVRPAPLNAGTNWSFQATSHVNPNSVTLADCNVVDTVLITNPLSGDPGHLSQASQKVPQLFINVGPGPVAVYCDPPSLALTKTAVSTVQSGDGYDAKFTVRATSTGPDPYIGTVEVDEVLPDGTSFVSSSNWSCVPTTGNDVHCSSSFKTIPVGKYTQMTITIHIPRDVAIASQCSVVNTVNASISAEVLHSDEGVQYTASATAELPASLCREPAQCPVKQVTPDGGCCDEGLVWNGKQCAKPRPKCPADSHVTAAGDCVCDEGTRGESGQCRPDVVEEEEEAPTCPDDSRLRRGECVCLQGTHGNPGKCRPDVVEEEEEAPTCPDDSHLRRGVCVCNAPLVGEPGQCELEIIIEEPTCPDDSHLRRGVCVCNAPLVGKPGRCELEIITEPTQPTEPTAPTCPDDSHFDTRQNGCVCNLPLQGKPGACTRAPTLELPTIRPNLKLPTIN